LEILLFQQPPDNYSRHGALRSKEEKEMMKKLTVLLLSCIFAVTVLYWEGGRARMIQAPDVTYGDKKITLRELPTKGSREVLGKAIKVIPLNQIIAIDYKN
jgi:hypothetical protein